MHPRIFNLLYVEDSLDDTDALRTAVEHAGGIHFSLSVMSDGLTAKVHLEQILARGAELPDLVLVDLNLPGLPGAALIRWLRGVERLKGLPVVAVSGVYDYRAVERSYDAGANLFVLKPGTPTRWRDLLFRLRGDWAQGGNRNSR